MEMASCSEISATAYMVDVQPHRKCIAEECNKANWGSERKTYFPPYINNKLVMVCVDQGSDLN